MAKKAYVYNGNAWEDLASSISDLSSYATTVDLDDYQLKSASGLTLINTTTFSAVASQSINDVFSATYDNYKIILQTTANATTNMRIKLRVAGVDSSASYGTALWLVDAAGTLNLSANNVTTGFYIQPSIADYNLASIDISLPFLVDRTRLVGTSTHLYYGDRRMLSLGGVHDVALSYTGFTIISTSLTGTVSVYGYQK